MTETRAEGKGAISTRKNTRPAEVLPGTPWPGPGSCDSCHIARGNLPGCYISPSTSSVYFTCITFHLQGGNAEITEVTEPNYAKYTVAYRVFSRQGRVADIPHYYRSQDGHYVSLIRNARVVASLFHIHFLTAVPATRKTFKPYATSRFNSFFKHRYATFCCVIVTNLLP